MFCLSRYALAAAPLALVFLACDEDTVPTSPLREGVPVVTAVSDTPVDVVALGTIPLPVNQTFNGTGLAFGITQTGTGPAGLFRINNAGNTGVALQGQTNGRGIAVRGLATSATGRAGVFESSSSTGNQDVLFAKANNNGAAVHAVANGFGMAGKFEGVRNGGSNTLYASALGGGNAFSAVNTGSGAAGLFTTTNPSSTAHALQVVAKSGGRAIRGVNTGQGGAAEFRIEEGSSSSTAVYVFNRGTGPAVQIQSPNGGLAISAGGSSEFGGDVKIVGTLSKSAGSFRIDHPLDPAHKYLSHSFVESPDMMNVYNGNATLDGRGEAVVMLPGYFEALNRDFRYQLTAVGAPGPNLHIGQRVRSNRFVIAGGVPGSEVSWQVTGVRHDPYAEAHRIEVETDKHPVEPGVALAR